MRQCSYRGGRAREVPRSKVQRAALGGHHIARTLVWSLRFGGSLELGVWGLVLGAVNGFYALSKTAEVVRTSPPRSHTPLKQGVNEKNPLRMAMFVKHLGEP